MVRIISIIFLVAFAIVDTEPGYAQRGYRPGYSPGFGATLPKPPPPLPDVNLRGTFDRHEQPPIVVKSPPAPPVVEPRPEVGMCCPCPGRDECSDVCCIRQ